MIVSKLTFKKCFFIVMAITFSVNKLGAKPKFLQPNQDELNLPDFFKNGKFNPVFPSPAPAPVRILTYCGFSDEVGTETTKYYYEVSKDSLRKFGRVISEKNGIVTNVDAPIVITQNLTKEMLGQYAVAVDIAHQLGITKVNSVRIYFLDMNPKQLKSLVYFYDEDGELLSRTATVADHWIRCE